MPRGALLVILVFVLGVLSGRLILEPSGTGLVIFLVALPALFFVLYALTNLGVATVLLMLYATIALVIRAAAAGTAGGWITLLLVPVVGMSLYFLVGTLRAMAAMRPEGVQREREEEE